LPDKKITIVSDGGSNDPGILLDIPPSGSDSNPWSGIDLKTSTSRGSVGATSGWRFVSRSTTAPSPDKGDLTLYDYDGSWHVRFRVQDSTGNIGINVTDPDEKLEVAGHYKASGTSPALSSCGTSPSITGADSAGKITIGTGVTTSCTVTFATTFAQTPACVVSGDNSAVGYAATTSTTVLTITSSADMAGDVISYICFGNGS